MSAVQLAQGVVYKTFWNVLCLVFRLVYEESRKRQSCSAVCLRKFPTRYEVQLLSNNCKDTSCPPPMVNGHSKSPIRTKRVVFVDCKFVREQCLCLLSFTGETLAQFSHSKHTIRLLT